MSNKEILPDQELLEEVEEKLPLRGATPEVKIPPGVEGWLKKIEKQEGYPPPVYDPQTGQAISYPPQSKKTKIVLPLTKKEFVVGLKRKVEDAARWLSEWCYRLIQMGPRRVVFES